MKKNTHPKYNEEIWVTCSCGNKFKTGSTVDEIKTELCSKCHPFYTGEQKIVDTENLVAKFEARQEKSKSLGSFRSKKEKMSQRKAKFSTQTPSSKSVTLKDMLASLSNQ